MGAGDVWEKTAAGAWTKRATLAAISQAEAWWSGAGDPVVGIGNDGDWYLDTTAAPAGTPPPLVTSLPGSPVDGQVVYYLADATNGTIWTLRYRAASPSTFKWEVVGGTPLFQEVRATDSSTANSVYQDLANVGPQLTAPLTGEYLLSWGAFCQGSVATAQQIMRLMDNGADSGFGLLMQPAGANYYGAGQSMRPMKFQLAAAHVYKNQYWVNTGVATWASRWMMMEPLRF